MLFIISSLLPITSGIKISKGYKLSNGVVDQSQDRCEEAILIEEYAWQEFIPTGENLLSVYVKICHWSLFSPDLFLSIEKPLGAVLTSTSLDVQSIPWEHCDWVNFDFSDISVGPGENYYIVLSHDSNGKYGWCGAWGDLYSEGESSRDAQWDWCFRTIVDKSKPKNPIYEEWNLINHLLYFLFKEGPLYFVWKSLL
jgi:hypothetical protein